MGRQAANPRPFFGEATPVAMQSLAALGSYSKTEPHFIRPRKNITMVLRVFGVNPLGAGIANVHLLESYSRQAICYAVYSSNQQAYLIMTNCARSD